ncbi:MAG: hypothetical protein EOM20_10650 [Spartobacteria bacterium]|nr:hypothetical protein [Spartobacteria bacterium]
MNQGNTMRRRPGTRLVPATALALALLCCAGGCRSTSRAPAIPGEPKEPIYRLLPTAHIIRVNQKHNYVILACTVLPSPGEQGKVYRNDSEVADILVTRYRQGAHVTAEIRQGAPETGDLVKFMQLISEDNDKEKQ